MLWLEVEVYYRMWGKISALLETRTTPLIEESAAVLVDISSSMYMCYQLISSTS